MSNGPNQSESASASPLAGLASKIRDGKKSAAQAEYDATPPKLSITHRRTAKEQFWITNPASILRVIIGAATRPVMCPPLKIELDGEVVATIEEGQKFDVVTSSGPHCLRILSTVGSATRDVELTNGQRLRFWCLNSISGVVFQRED
jgi:hypothetical protein